MQPVLVVSVDGLAPRVITPETMPRLCGLAGSGASCFGARTVVPPIAVPAHASMFRGIDPARHLLFDNSSSDVASDAPSFLAVARAAGLRTASVLCWPPLDRLLEPDACHERVTFDAGYDPDDDLVVTKETIDTLQRTRPDVTLTYLVATDLAGHASGWGSGEYLAAAALIDARLGELIDAVGPDTAIVVTTDHGGEGRNHVDPVPATLETFVVVRSDRVAPGSMWSDASVLDVAPTVADLVDIEPSPAWEGVSLMGSERPIVDHLLELVGSMGHHTYGERLDMLQHSLQTAAGARHAGGSESLILAALLHDVGHLLGDAGEWGLADHAEVGARHLQAWLAPDVVEPIRLHVAAKRYLVATDPEYLDVLSEASIETLRLQGGPFDAGEIEAFAARPHAEAALLLRRLDDGGKIAGAEVEPLTTHRARLSAHLHP